MINAYWRELEFNIQEGTAAEWTRIVDTGLSTPNDFSNSAEPLRTPSYPVSARSVVVLLRLR